MEDAQHTRTDAGEGVYGDSILYLPVDTFLDEVAVYDTALSASRVGVHYNTGKNGA